MTRAEACRVTRLNKGNFYAFLKGDTSKMSRKTAMNATAKSPRSSTRKAEQRQAKPSPNATARSRKRLRARFHCGRARPRQPTLPSPLTPLRKQEER